MSVIFRIDTQLTTLKDALIKDISNHKNDIFQCSYIATTGEGVTAWISENIAKTNGIHAHFKYVSIQEILTQIYRATQPHQKMINNKDFIWLIYDVLFEGHSKNEAINEYFRVQPISCCMMIADLLDKYQMYRPDMIAHWESNTIFTNNETLEVWQKEIWLAVQSKINARNNQQSFYGVLQDLKNITKSDLEQIKNKIPAVFLFNILGITPIQKEILEKIAEIIPVYVYLKHVDYTTLEDWSNIVHQTLKVWNIEHQPTPKEIQKDKIVLHSHFSIKREVEGWYNYLIHLQDTETLGRKIWVAVPDIKTYAPYIRAVMDNAPQQLHYTIADEVHLTTDETLKLYTFLLQLQYENFDIDQLIQLCRFTIIQKKFGIVDVDFITEALIASKARRKFNFNDTERDQYSINKGIKRLILGIFTETDVKVDDVYPIAVTDDFGAQLNLVGLAQLVEELEHYLEETSAEKKNNIQLWMFLIDSMIKTFIDLDDEEQEDSFTKINATVKSIKHISSQVQEITFSEVKKYLLSTIEDQQSKTQFINTGITFSSMLPYRGLPFDYIAILGLNNDFPAQNNFNAYDLTALEQRPGDRNITDNNNHLILEAIDSASKQTYFSYLGVNQNTLKTEYPSTVITRLFDIAIEALYHPLQKGMGKSITKLLPDYYHQFQEHSQKDDYTQYTLLQNKESNETKFNSKDVINFCTDSVEFHYKKLKGIRIPEENEIPIYEPLQLNNLEIWGLKNDLIQQILDYHEIGKIYSEEDFNRFLEKKNDKAELTLKSDIIIEDLKNFHQELMLLIQPQLSIQKIEIEAFHLKNVLIDYIDGYWDGKDQYYYISPSSKGYKYILRAYINGLLLMDYQNLPQITIYTSFKGKAFEEITFVRSEIELLNNLIDDFNEHHLELFPLLIEMIEFDEQEKIISELQSNYPKSFKYRSEYFRRFEDLYDLQNANWNLTFEILNRSIKPLLKVL